MSRSSAVAFVAEFLLWISHICICMSITAVRAAAFVQGHAAKQSQNKNKKFSRRIFSIRKKKIKAGEKVFFIRVDQSQLVAHSKFDSDWFSWLRLSFFAILWLQKTSGCVLNFACELKSVLLWLQIFMVAKTGGSSVAATLIIVAPMDLRRQK